MKPYAKWAEAEVVEYLFLEMPETRTNYPTIVKEWGGHGLSPFVTGAAQVAMQSKVALWFRAAWDWYVRHNDGRTLICAEKDRDVFAVFGEPNTQAVRSGLPTAVHALGVACLVLVGKAVPE